MDNKEIDRNVLGLISSGIAVTQASLAATVRQDNRAIDNSLKRLKSKGLVQFSKELKRWQVADASEPSAPEGEGVVGSDSEPEHPAEGNNQMNDQEGTNNDGSTDINEVDRAIDQARSSSSKGSSRTRLTPEERAARDKERELERTQRKAERDRQRAEKKNAKEQTRQPAHMSKVNKAASRLPELSDTAQEVFTDVTTNLSRDQVAALAAHLVHFNRAQATERALSQKIAAGDTVRITGGEPRFIGMVGTVSKAQRIRCYVEVEGVKRPVYLFTSDVQLVESAKATATG